MDEFFLKIPPPSRGLPRDVWFAILEFRGKPCRGSLVGTSRCLGVAKFGVEFADEGDVCDCYEPPEWSDIEPKSDSGSERGYSSPW